MSTIIDANDLSYAYGDVQAVSGVTVTVSAGEFHGLIGPNGSGKTTLLKLLLGVLRPDSGRVELFGVRADRFEQGERIGYVSQRSTAGERSMPITVREVVTLGRYPHVGLGRLTEADRAIVDESLDRVGIRHVADRRASRLSGGQLQRVIIARALAAEADLLALDEPTIGIDADARDAFYSLLQDLNEEGITILLIEHDIGVVTEYASHITCINREPFYHGPTEGFLESDALARAYGGGLKLELGPGELHI